MKARTLCTLMAAVSIFATVHAHAGTISSPNNEKKPAAKKKFSATHPFYRSALTQLRTARWMIAHHPINWQPQMSEREAIAHIDAAISSIVKASIDDGKTVNDRPKAARKKDSPDRLTMALGCLKQARVNISRDGDKSLAEGLQLHAYEQIDGAIRAVRVTLKS